MSVARTWSTSFLPESEQFPFWRDVCWQAFVPVSLARPGEGPFPSEVSAWQVGPIGVSHIRSLPQSVTRTETDISRRAGDAFFLNLPLSDGTSASQHGRTARLAAEDFVLLDGARPFHLEFEQAFEQVSLTVPHELLAPLLASPGDATAVRVTGDRGVGAVASGAIRSLASAGASFDRHGARAVSDQLAGLVALALGGIHSSTPSASRAQLLQAALDTVERRLDDPDLSPSGVAESLAISTRYLHRLFADRGTTFCRFVLGRRLQRCHRDLEDPSRGHWTIAEIAVDHGFRDPAYFARAFKRRYGTTPREVRLPALRRQPAGA